MAFQFCDGVAFGGDGTGHTELVVVEVVGGRFFETAGKNNIEEAVGAGHAPAGACHLIYEIDFMGGGGREVGGVALRNDSEFMTVLVREDGIADR